MIDEIRHKKTENEEDKEDEEELKMEMLSKFVTMLTKTNQTCAQYLSYPELCIGFGSIIIRSDKRPKFYLSYSLVAWCLFKFGHKIVKKLLIVNC